MAYKRLVKKMTIENLWLYILRLLMEKPMYGREIIQALKERYDIKSASVTIYVVLYRMEREGLIKKIKRKNKKINKNGRAYYEPTKKGVETFQKGLKFINAVYQKLNIGEVDAYKI